MSTNILEEASAIGDRIVILNKGKVRCFGSPSFLSNAIGELDKCLIQLQYTSVCFEMVTIIVAFQLL